MKKRDYYEILGIDKNSKTSEIKKAYRRIAIKYHPDKNPNNPAAEDKFKEASEAYEVLSNNEKKEQYDQFGHSGVNSRFNSQNINVEDIFSQFSDIFEESEGFDSFFGKRKSNKRSIKKGENLRIKIKMNLKEIAYGIEKKVKVKRYGNCDPCKNNGSKNGNEIKKCKKCNGAGEIQKVSNTILGQIITSSKCRTCLGKGKIIIKYCTSCKGEGRLLKEELVYLKIPSGVNSNMQLSISEKGNMPIRGGVPGDLLVLIEEEEHKVLKREENNITYKLYISFVDAILGNTIEIPTIDGNTKIKISSGIQSGKILKLKGKGIKDINGYGRGDQKIHINIWTPQKLNKEEKNIFELLKNSENFKPKYTNKRKSLFEKIKTFF